MARNVVARAMTARAGNAHVAVEADNRHKVVAAKAGRGSYRRKELRVDIRNLRDAPKAIMVALGASRGARGRTGRRCRRRP